MDAATADCPLKKQNVFAFFFQRANMYKTVCPAVNGAIGPSLQVLCSNVSCALLNHLHLSSPIPQLFAETGVGKALLLFQLRIAALNRQWQ